MAMLLGGLSLVLHTTVLIQLIVGFPLLVHVKLLQKPSLEILKFCSSGRGHYIVTTLGACISLLFGTSVFELYRLETQSSLHDTSIEASMVAMQKGSAHINAVLALFAMTLGALLPRLSKKIRDHDVLKANHEALLRQARGLGAEYQRATSSGAVSSDNAGVDEVTRLKQQVTNLLRGQETLTKELSQAAESKRTSEASLNAMKSQAKNLESAYDALSDDNRRLKVQLAQAGVEVSSKKGE